MIDRFQPTRLYIKELAGVKYFGKTSREDIMTYTGIYSNQTVQEMKGDPRKIKFGWQLLGPSE
jgi:hypothetical protein